MNDQEKKIKQFWNEQADEFKDSQLATAPDVNYRDLEIRSIIQYLKNGTWLLDVGCGNGYSTFKFAEAFPRMKITGIDYSEEMIAQAQNALEEKKGLNLRVDFQAANVLSLSSDLGLKQKFDYIISERCLINLLDWQQQASAILQMKKLLKKNGRIILCENTKEGLARLNCLRQKLGLKPIAVRWHNYYLPENKLIEFARKHFKVEEVNNIGSLYYVISRVVYAKLCDLKKEEPEYLNPINEIASQLPAVGNYSPNFIFILRNKN